MKSTNIISVCVYCASSPKIDQVFFEATEALAHILVDQGIHVKYGAGSIGLMGKIADVYLEKGGNITGIIPEFMHEVEWTHKGLTDVIVTQSMHERKALLYADVDAVITLPGGCGTLEELLEVITLKRLGVFTKPIVILNTNGYYNPLREMLESCVSHHFMSEIHLKMYRFVDEPFEVIPAILDMSSWSHGAIQFAVPKII